MLLSVSASQPTLAGWLATIFSDSHFGALKETVEIVSVLARGEISCENLVCQLSVQMVAVTIEPVRDLTVFDSRVPFKASASFRLAGMVIAPLYHGDYLIESRIFAPSAVRM